MSNRNNPLTVYLTDKEKAQLKEWADEAGKSQSDLGREAILEYLDYDRLDRIESELSELTDMVEALAEQDTRTHKHDTQMKASETVEKTRTIAKRLNRNHSATLDESEINRAIKDIAGGDHRTIEKYQEELKERQHAYEHPNPDSETWFLALDVFVSDLEGYASQTQKPEAIIQRELSQYGLSFADVADKLEVIEV